MKYLEGHVVSKFVEHPEDLILPQNTYPEAQAIPRDRGYEGVTFCTLCPGKKELHEYVSRYDSQLCVE